MKDGLCLVGVKDSSGSDWRIRGRQREEPEGCHLSVGHYYWRCWPQVHCRSSTTPRMLPQSPASQDKGPTECSLLHPQPIWPDSQKLWMFQSEKTGFVPLCPFRYSANILRLFLCATCVFSHSVVSESATPCTVASQAPLSKEFSGQEYWSGLPFPTPGDLPDPGIEPESLASPALAGRFFAIAPPGKPVCTYHANFSNAILFH